MPTSDIAVRCLLRAAAEPVSLFGETALQRRARLEAYWRLNGASLPPTVLDTLKVIVSCGNAAVDFRGRKLGGAAVDESSSSASRSVKIADTFGRAPQHVAEFRRSVLDATLDRAKGRMMLLRQEFLNQRPLVALIKEASEAGEAPSFLRSTPVTPHTNNAQESSHQLSSTGGNDTKRNNIFEVLSAQVSIAKQEVAQYVHTATLKAPATVSSGGQHLRSSVTTACVVPQTVVCRLLPNKDASSKTSTVVATGHEDGRLWLWDVCTSTLLNSSASCVLAGISVGGEVVPFRCRITSIAFHPVQPLLLVTRRLKDAEVYTLRANEAGVAATLTGLMSKHLGVVHRVAVDPSGSYAITTSEDMTIGVWDVRQAALAAGGAVMAEEEVVGGEGAGDRGTTVRRDVPRLLYLQDGHNAASKHNSVFEVAFHPDGSLFTTTDFAGFSVTWDVRSGRKLVQGTIVHTGRCTSVDWAPSGLHYATGGDDGLVHIYDFVALLKLTDTDTKASKKEAPPRAVLRTIAAHRDTVTSIEFERTQTHLPVYGHRVTGSQGPDGLRSNVLPKWLMTSSVDGTVKLWCTNSGALLRCLVGAVGSLRYGLGGGSTVAARVACHVPSYDPAQAPHRAAATKATVEFAKEASISGATSPMPPAACVRDHGMLPMLVTCDHSHGWRLWQASANAFVVHKVVEASVLAAPFDAADVPVVPAAVEGGDSDESDDDEMAKLRNKKRRVEPHVSPAPTAVAKAPPTIPTAAESDDSDDEMATLRKRKGK